MPAFFSLRQNKNKMYFRVTNTGIKEVSQLMFWDVRLNNAL